MTSLPDDDSPHDAITAEEIAGTASPQAKPASSTNKRTNAFTELMTNAKKPKPDPDPSPPKSKKTYNFRDGLGIYIDRPEDNPDGRVVEYDDEFVVIRDMFPKASVHLLLLPRDPAISSLHPLHALTNNPTLLASIRTRVSRLKPFVASELRRLYGANSASDQPYQTALTSILSSSSTPPPLSTLPSGRDWSSEVLAGVHTHPSMNHLHIHILTRDLHSPCVKSKKHYLSFKTSFFVGLEEFPLDTGTEEGRRRFRPGDWPKWELVCWRCGRGFGNRWAELGRHLEGEFEGWRRE